MHTCNSAFLINAQLIDANKNDLFHQIEFENVITTANSILLPFAYLTIANGDLHLVLITTQDKNILFKHHEYVTSVDVVWVLNPVTRESYVSKDRTGQYDSK